jgi:hypothetical protein
VTPVCSARAPARAADGPFAALPLLLARRIKHVAADLEFIEEFRAAFERWAGPAVVPHVEPARNGRLRSVRKRDAQTAVQGFRRL